MSTYPTPWQKRTMWAALTAMFVVLLIVIAGAVVYVGANLTSFLQPILIPAAIAVILAYLLDPLVTELCRRKMSRGWAVAVIFAGVAIALVGLVAWVAPAISMQSASFARELPNYTQKARDRIVDVIVQYNRVVGGTTRGKAASSSIVNFLLGTPPPRVPSPTPATSATPSPSPQAGAAPVESISAAPAKISSAERQQLEAKAEKIIPNLERYLPTLAEKIWNIVKKSIGGFLGAFGFLLSLVMVPIYLFFLLKERPRIEKRWKDYLPLRASPLKQEIAAALTEINSYVLAYFRGQLLVCLVDGTLIGSILTLYGLSFAPLIGLFVVILTMIPYIGIVICWVPAVLIAAFQYGDWTHPIIVTVIFIVVQNLEGMFYAPRIVGQSLGLHPMTVIVSIFVWGLLIGGLLGPILAVPLTATIKVLLTRYVWGPRLREPVRGQLESVPVVQEAKSGI
ncbi:MAG TPA: AI-2E family transporter [Chthoniobacterales bacterium]|nr:AI-2E family transporter [Chthoniobacterales bacterium]